ncbi:MAG: condensation domain-containing protein, partial [Defluviitaleaceae bacterium]|nr:condensation domain-containing protein [Defluviitaleaceae bacterium]
MSTIDDRLSQLSPEKKAMLEKLLREKRLQQVQGGPKIKPIKLENNRYPLTFAQEKIWIANNISPDATIYNMIGIARIQGKADVPSFIEALKETFSRHEILKMHFKQDGGEIYAELDENMSFEPELHDFSHELRDRDEIIEEMMNRLAGKPFDLEKDTLIRAALACTAPDDWTVVLVMHHLVGDGMSISVVLGETLEYCYNKHYNLVSNKQPLPIQFKDFAWWERNKEVESLNAELAKKYWNEQLDGADFSLDILKEEQGLTHFDEISIRQDIRIGADVVNKIQHIAQNEKVTVFIIYFAALQLLIHKYSMQKDIVTGVVTAGRDMAEVQPMVGCFVDILPVRTMIDNELTFIDFIKDAYKIFLGNYEKKDAFLQREGSLIYQLLFNYKETPKSEIAIEGLEINSNEIDNGFSRAAMDFELIKFGEEIIGGINYRKGVLDDDFVQEFINRYYLLLDKIVDESSSFLHEKLSTIAIIDEQEEEELLKSFNGTEMPYPSDKTVIEIFETEAS